MSESTDSLRKLVPAAASHARWARWAVLFLLAIHSGLLAYSAYVHSPTMNEPGHLVAGLSYWQFGRFDVYRVNPPLVRLVAALPVMAAGYNDDWSGFYEGPGARPEFKMGEDFVAANGERSFFLFMIARWACIPFSWIGAGVCYLWARDLYGRLAGVVACGIWCFEPNILAHGPLITPDVPATALGVAACYTFWRWLLRPSWTQAALTGVVLGLAELCKMTLVVFFPLWPVMWVIYRWPNRRGMLLRDWAREAGMLALRMAVGLYVLNLGYGFEGSFTRLTDFHFVSDLFTGRGAQSVADSLRESTPHAEREDYNRFADSWLGPLPVPLPKNYLLGIDLQRKDFEHYSRKSYLRGEWRDRGWWYYYLYAAAIKVPLGLWLLGLLTLAGRVLGVIPLPHSEGQGEGSAPRLRSAVLAAGQPPAPNPRDEAILLFPSLFIFAFVSSQTGFNEHFRYVLPSFPFFFIWASQVMQLLQSNRKIGTAKDAGNEGF